MLSKITITLCLLLSVFCLQPPDSQAHKVRIFAYAEGNTISGETAFSGGRTPKNAEIIIEDAASAKKLLTCRTDAQGLFHFPIPEEARQDRMNLRIIINVGDGHRGEWLLEAAEYLPDSTSKLPPAEKQESVAETSSSNIPTKSIPVDEELLRRVVEEALDTKLSPIMRILVKSQNKGPRLQDILGGIGYILGLAGIIAYINSKNGEKK